MLSQIIDANCRTVRRLLTLPSLPPRSQAPDTNFDKTIWECLLDFGMDKWFGLFVWLLSRPDLIPFALPMLLLVGVASYFDRRDLYVRDPPPWLRPLSHWTFRSRFFLHLRLQHSLLRAVYVVPGHTECTRLQLTVALINQLLITLCSILTWFDKRQCAVEASLVAAMIALMTVGLHQPPCCSDSLAS